MADAKYPPLPEHPSAEPDLHRFVVRLRLTA